MITTAQLNSWLGKSMPAICLNGFDGPSFNHCAHFVARVLAFWLALGSAHADAGILPYLSGNHRAAEGVPSLDASFS